MQVDFATFAHDCEHDPAIRGAWQDFEGACYHLIAAQTGVPRNADLIEQAKRLVRSTFSTLEVLCEQNAIPAITLSENTHWSVLRRTERFAH